MKENCLSIKYADVMKNSYLDYAMSVIAQRALPDVRDGLKPVHRRILYAMNELGLYYNKPFRKSARIVGDVLGKFHPHGDKAVYDAMVRLSQDFKMMIPLIKGHGNFGSIDGDSSASMRYTEARLTEFSNAFLEDLDKDVVPFKTNFDNTLNEPVVLPAKVPNLLINGSSGIAVGMASFIPPHNLKEVIEGVIEYIDNNNITISKLMKKIKAPDFPTGGIIVNKKDLKTIYETGTGKIKIRAKINVEDSSYGRTNLVITEIPYTFSGNKQKLIDNIISKINEGVLSEITDVYDESGKEGIRIILETKRGVNIDKLLNKLYKYTKLEDTFNVNFLALVDNSPKVLNLKDIIYHFVEFQKEIYTRVYEYKLNKTNERLEVVKGFIKAIDMIDLIIEIIRGSRKLDDVKNCLMYGDTSNVKFKTKSSEKKAKKLNFSKMQTEAIINMRLHKLIGLETEKLITEEKELTKNIEHYKNVLSNENELLKVIKNYLIKIKEKYGHRRKTKVTDIEDVPIVEEFIEKDVYILIDRFNYVKSIDKNSYVRANKNTLEKYKHIIKTKNTDKILIFTDKGNMYQLKISSFEESKLSDKGTLLDVLINLNNNENILLVDTYNNIENKHLIFVTKKGYCKLIKGSEYLTNRGCILSTKLIDEDTIDLIAVVDEEKINNDYLVTLSNEGFILKFKINEISVLGRNTRGVNCMQLNEGDFILKSFIVSNDVNKIITLKNKTRKEIIDLSKVPLSKRYKKGKKVIGFCNNLSEFTIEF